MSGAERWRLPWPATATRLKVLIGGGADAAGADVGRDAGRKAGTSTAAGNREGRSVTFVGGTTQVPPAAAVAPTRRLASARLEAMCN